MRNRYQRGCSDSRKPSTRGAGRTWTAWVPLTSGDSLRPYRTTDGPAVVALVVSAGMFSQDEAGFLAEGALEGGDDGAPCFVEDAEDGHGLVSVLFYRPEEAADRAYDLTMIAVRPDLQGGGRGAALMRYAEDDLRQRNQRLLIVCTSGTSQYAATRAFYRGSITRNSRASRTTGLTATTSLVSPSA